MTDWDERELGDSVAEAYREPVSSDPRAKQRLLDRLRQEKPPRRGRRPLVWLLEPVRLQVRPAAALAAGLILVAVGALAALGLSRPGSGAPKGDGQERARSTASTPVVRFVLVAPRASHVALVGDFNAWDPEAAPMRRVQGRNGTDDTWTVAVSIPRGRHVYAFVVDGKEWMADPLAPLAPEDDFGSSNSVIVVGGREST